jgi:ATP-binding cassette, subfamily B, bacterial
MRFVTRLLATARELWPYYVAITLCSVLVAGAGMVSPFLIKAATDQLVTMTTGRGPRLIVPLVWLAVGLFAVEAARSVISNVAGYLGDVMSARLRATLSARYFHHLLRLPQRYLDNEQTGTLIGRLNRSITEVAQFLNVFANNMLPMLLTLVASLAVMAWYSWPIALLVVLMYPVFTWLTALTSSKWQRLEKAKNAEVDVANGRFAEAVIQLRVVKSFVAEIRELRHFTDRYDTTIGLTREQSRFWHLMDIARQVALNVIFFGIYVVIFLQTAAGSYSVGTMVLLVQMVTMARMPVTGMSYLVDTAQRAVAGSRDYFAVMAEPVEAEALPEPDRSAWPAVQEAPAVSFRDLTFGYGDGPAVLEGVTFDVARGERVAFVGESGGGKTTLVSLLLRLYDPRCGQILIDGVDISGAEHGAVRERVGVVFQDPSLFSGTIRENIAYGEPSRADDRAIEEAARRAHVQPFVEKLPGRYDTEIGERGLKLSGGQKQRVAIARALHKDAPILVLDEATSSLDTRAERQVQAGLDELMTGRTTLIIAHRLSTISSVDRIVTLRDGRVDEIGTPDELAVSGGIYSELLALQASASRADRRRLAAYDIAG